MKNKIIEKLENILYEYGWITRPHGDETDDILRDFESELQSLQESQEQSEGEEVTTLLSSVIIKPTCIETHGGENEAYLVAMELLRKRFILFALGTKDRTFRIELHLEKQ